MKRFTTFVGRELDKVRFDSFESDEPSSSTTLASERSDSTRREARPRWPEAVDDGLDSATWPEAEAVAATSAEEAMTNDMAAK